ncbi:MAG: anaerobic glycerol-3-phosphate dehydrogenase subunit GlpC [Desulfosudaceae bacterium]
MIELKNISFDHCIKCAICTAYCPVARATPFYPGPKYSGPDAERMRIKTPFLADQSLRYCNNCKRCETVCPSGVRITDFIYQARHSRLNRKKRLRDFMLTHTDLTGRLATLAPAAANRVFQWPPVRKLLDLLVGLSARARFPKFARGTFAGNRRRYLEDQGRFSRHVVYFHGCYVNYYDHELGHRLISVLNAMDIGVTLPPQRCCGVPLIAAGNFKKVRKNALANIADLTRATRPGDDPIVFTSSSCALTVTQDYPNLLDLDITAISDNLVFVTRFLHHEFQKGNRPALRPLDITAAYHSPCHLERAGGVIHTIAVLKQIPGLRLIILHSECCGIAGTYGFKKEYQEIAGHIGRNLFEQIAAVSPDIVITDCETCKWQIEANTVYPVRHPVSVLAEALASPEK